ncbi:MAG: hypothetical protein KGY60_13035 [Bacteroidales bacterium]|nr:hypothetical protein [Bacteroidales bacterium]
MFKTSTIFKSTFVFSLLMLLLPALSLSQDADPEAKKILEQWQENYEASIQDIEDFVMVKENHTIYNKKKTDDEGHPYFKTRTESDATGNAKSTSTVSRSGLFDRGFRSEAKNKAIYKGKEEVNGHPVHVVYIDKLEGIMETPEPDNALRDIYLYIDPEDWVVRQMEYSVPFTDGEGQVREVHPVIRNRDFRDVKGMMIPYETKVTISGLAMTEEERQEAKKSVKEVEEQLEEMPEQQRKMAEQMMGERMKEARQALKEDQMERVREVKEVRVNTGMEDF